MATVAATAGVGAWLGAVAKGDSVAFWDAIGAGLNLVPLALAVLGLGTLVHGLWPRAVNSVVIVIVAGGYVWNLVAELVRAPAWVRDVSPFQHVAPFPATAARPVALIALALVGLVAVGVGAMLIDRRDVHSG